jgi:hypothetical protein
VELLGGYLLLLADAATSGREPHPDELEAVGLLGRRAAELGVSAGSVRMPARSVMRLPLVFMANLRVSSYIQRSHRPHISVLESNGIVTTKPKRVTATALHVKLDDRLVAQGAAPNGALVERHQWRDLSL